VELLVLSCATPFCWGYSHEEEEEYIEL